MAEHVCPVWIGYLLASPVRKLFQNPATILSPYVHFGMKVMDIGCAMGFFSLPLARLVGREGSVICVDMQDKMIQSLEKRAKRAALSGIIETRLCRSDTLGLADIKETIDFVLAFAVVHEVPQVSSFFSEIYETMRPNAKLLLAEPKGHVSEKDFAGTLAAAESIGFQKDNAPRIFRSRSALLIKV
jgi:2-polyprenyl-3-methyl-5-hydroxy-6-metoxy-1,4-benzoquinol methylase